jgi:hypothetical protein
MGNEIAFGFFLLLGLVGIMALALGLRAFSVSVERRRIAQYVEERGGRVIAWKDLGPLHSGLSEVRYRDHEGNIHESLAHFGMFAGVSLTENRIVHRATRPVDERELELLEEENARLRAENERLRRGNRDPSADAIQEQ